jgi:hypothetical protein
VNVLIASFALRYRQGGEVYARDLALELQRQGHSPTVYASALGPLADELRAAGVPVITRLRSLISPPDIIHGNFRRATLAALLHFPNTPVVSVCHSHTGWPGGAAIHPRIGRYLGMSGLCVTRLREEGVPEKQIEQPWNFVDLNRFRPRPPLPEQPRRALLFSNYAHANSHLPAVTEACRRADLELDVVGAGVNNPVAHPEELLGRYDLVFAKAKAAMEAMAVGTAVVLCDFGGAGPLVTSANFDRLCPMNFGFQSLDGPLEPEYIQRQIAGYNAEDALRVRDLLRGSHSLEHAVTQMVHLYQTVIHEHQIAISQQTGAQSLGAADRAACLAALARDTVRERMIIFWLGVPHRRREQLFSLPGFQILRGQIRKLFR